MSEFVYAPKPIEIVGGDGSYLIDTAGEQYLDAGASFGCAPVGHCHPTVVDAIQEQASSLTFVQGSYPNPTRTSLVKRLASLGPGDCTNVWLCNSGTEANEAAIKFARSATDRSAIVATTRGFHGRTMGSLSATWKPAYRQPFEPLLADIEFVPFGDAEALETAVTEETAAVIIEPIQGEGGVNVPPDGYLTAVRECTESAGAAMILDEIQTGLGRTGSFWACDATGVVPDILTTAKGIASGVPMGATLCRQWIADGAGPHGSTFSGSPIAAAAANATLEVIEEMNLTEQAAVHGETLMSTLTESTLDIKAIRGYGLLIGLDVRRGANVLAKQLAIDHGILTMPAGRSVLRLLPPLTIDAAEVEQLVTGIEAALDQEASA